MSSKRKTVKQKQEFRNKFDNEVTHRVALLMEQFKDNPDEVKKRYTEYVKQVVINYAACFLNEDALRADHLIHSEVIKKYSKKYTDTLVKLEGRHYDALWNGEEATTKIFYDIVDKSALALASLDMHFLEVVIQIGLKQSPELLEDLKQLLNKYNKCK